MEVACFFILGVADCILQKWLQYLCPGDFPEPFHSLPLTPPPTKVEFMSPPVTTLTNNMVEP